MIDETLKSSAVVMSTSTLKYIAVVCGAICAILGISKALVYMWFILMILDTIVGMAYYSTIGEFTWKALRAGVTGKISAFIVIIAFALVGLMAKEHGVIPYIDVISIGFANTLIFANGASEAVSILSNHRQMRGKPPIAEIDVFGIFGTRFQKAVTAFLRGDKKDDT